jgi:hypothetical protein
MRPEPLLEAGDGTEGLGVALGPDRLPVDGCAVCETIEAQTLVKVSPYVWQPASQPHGTSVFDSIDLDEAILASSDLKCSNSCHAFSLRALRFI